MQRATSTPLDLSAGPTGSPGVLDRWKLPVTIALLALAVVGAALWLTRRPVEQPLAVPTPGGDAARPLKVHVTGAVANPGLYTLPRSDRVDDAIQAAGGALAGADLSRVNLALPLRDGQQVVVPLQPSAQPTSAGASTAAVVAAPPAVAAPIATARPSARATRVPTPGPGSKVNLNRASAAELEALPGIGAATARRIVEHRDKSGAYQSTEELRKARLITNRVWDQIKDLIDAP